LLVKDYPFTKTRPDDTARPYLPVTILNQKKNKEINVYALIDTGADECALPASFASLLGHKLKSGYEKDINTGNGLTVAYSHSIRIKAFNFITNEVLIDFMPNLHIPLLGVKSFLSNFVLTINYKDSKFSLL
jgi:predicted aspartyl protease